MKKFLVLILAGAMLALPACRKHKFKPAPVVRTALEIQHAATHRIAVYDFIEGEVGHCSATAIGPHALLTAQHCFKDSNVVRLDNEKVTTTIYAALLDGNDHVIYLVDRTFTDWAGVNERSLIAGEPVHMWGNPGRNSDMYRDGYFDKIEKIKHDPLSWLKFMLPIYPGDSGSGIFDANGSVVAVISMCNTSAENYDQPLAFTQRQLDATQP